MDTPHSSGLNNTELPEFPDGMYYPVRSLPGAMFGARVWACIEIALEHAFEHKETDKQAAASIVAYQAIVQSWDLPGCRAVIDEMARYKEDLSTWVQALPSAVKEGRALPDLPHEFAFTLLKTKRNDDYSELVKHAHSFVLTGFNRQRDIENQTPKVVPEKSPLSLAIIPYSLVHYLPNSDVEESEWPAVLTNESAVAFWFFRAWLMDTSTTRLKRRAQKEIRQALKREGYELKHDSVIRQRADVWYKCRVNPGSIEQYISDLANEHPPIILERSNVETAIAPYDQATGYPRKWRK